MSKKKILLAFFLLFLSNCAEKIDPATGEKTRIEPNPQTKAKEFADKGQGIFGDINNKK